MTDDLDKKLLTLLRSNARLSVSALARELRVSRSTVQDRIGRLEDRQIIAGYTVRLGTQASERRVRAFVMLKISPKSQDAVVAFCKSNVYVRALYTLAGEFDLAALVSADTTIELDEALDAIARVRGVERTQSSLLLSTKFERG